ncbi:(R)-mandelonitrile lyase 1-like [Cucumis melo var. makuwa]|uniref:(R)-mandelonitrile lyase 1-like n=1 Tax=Cucumis melo var. makuwa TaxID=1194695 RepID=A0A5D3BAV1_CUCMM|nr:(R)-mandelonitrile lyase 1-like [Cucumis melo var. makuwa]TYJ95741.1 (R)-mandelonitrile lyase 1-like [Cucumis melo var. makuwa]
MISSYSRWDLHLMFDPTVDASLVGTMAFPSGFDDTDAIFYFDVDVFNNAGGMPSTDDTSDAFQPSTSTPRRQQLSKSLKLERYVQQNRKIPISIALRRDKPISPHTVHFSCTISVLTWDTFPIRFHKWTNVTLKYIELVKGSLQKQSMMNRAARVKQPYNHNSGSKSFLQ